MTPPRFRFAGLLLLPALLAPACCRAASDPPPETFTCPDGRSLVLAYHPATDVMTAEWQGMRHALTHRMSADGARYADATLEIWNTGLTTRVTDLASGAEVTCERH